MPVHGGRHARLQPRMLVYRIADRSGQRVAQYTQVGERWAILTFAHPGGPALAHWSRPFDGGNPVEAHVARYRAQGLVVTLQEVPDPRPADPCLACGHAFRAHTPRCLGAPRIAPFLEGDCPCAGFQPART